MKRYFYNDSLEAAYMAKHYGMEFMGAELSIIGNSCAWYHKHPSGGCSWSDSFYVDGNSLHLLERQLGDLCETDSNSYQKQAFYVTKDGFQYPCYDGDYDSKNPPQEPYKIIQRNNRPFFYPESGEV